MWLAGSLVRRVTLGAQLALFYIPGQLPRCCLQLAGLFPQLAIKTRVQHHDQKPPREQRVYFTLQVMSLLPGEARLRTQGRNLQSGTDTEAMEKRCLLARSSGCDWDSLLSYRGSAPPTVNWALPHQSSITEMHHSLARRPIWCGHFLRLPFSGGSRLCVKFKFKLTKTPAFFLLEISLKATSMESP